MSDVKRVTLTTISDVVKKGGGGGTSIGGPFGALDGANAMGSAFGGGPAFAGGGSHSPAGKESSAGSGGAGPEGGKSGSGKKHKTVRLELNLFEPTAESFPEFNFAKLVHEEQKRLKKAQKKQHDEANNGFLSDPELDNDVARMARELERKYGSGTAYAGKEKFARPSKLDYYDRGAGYDEEDSFIDNSEAYDELIPQEIETVGGGFYINSGQLEFKQLSNFERPDDVHRMPKPKKRALSTTSESSDDDEPPANAKKKTEERGQPPVAPSQPAAQASSEKPTVANPEPPLAQQQASEGESVNAAGNSGLEVAPTTGDEKLRVNGHVAKRQKLTDNGPLGAPKGVAGVEKDKAKSSTGTKATMDEGGKEKTNGVKPKVSTVITQPPVAGGPTVALGTPPPVSKKDENENDGGVKLIKTTTVKDMLRAKRDSLRKMEQEKKGRSSGSSRVSSSEAEEDGDGGGDEDDEDEENDEDDDEDDEEDDEDEEMGEGSDKESNESGSEEDIGSESESSHADSTSEKDAAARAKVVATTNGTGGEGERSVTVDPTEQQQQQKDKEKEKEKERKRKESKLPDELPESLRKVVDTLKELAQTHAIGGKLNYFDSKVAEVLLQVDEGARAAGNSTRNAIFRHLEAQLSISRQSLQLKIKKIRIRKLEGRAKVALDQLEDTICDQMPLLLAKHELDCRKVAEQRAAQAAATAAAAGTSVLPPGGSDPATMNGEKPGPQTTTTAASTPQIRNPKKRYTWNERTRDLLWELYSIRVESFAFLRPRNETEDDFVAEYLRNKVVPLWPKGWMRYEDLHKELDRRKKALAKSAPAAALGGPVPKKPPLVVLPPLTSPPSSAIDPSWMTSSGTTTIAMNGSAKATGTPSAGGGGKSGSSPGAIAAAPLTSQVPANLSPNGVSSKRGSSDHSISNIMNSPPLPPPPAGEKNRSQPTGRRSFDDDQLMLSPPNPAGSVVERDGTSAKRGLLVSPPDHKTASLPVSDRPRWNSREDDSDSSIEIIGEYNVIGGSTGAHGPPPVAGVIHSAKSLIQSNPSTPTSTTTTNVLPVLNKEKYKNLIAGKNKGHGSGGGNSPVGSTDTSLTGGVLVGPGKYSKHPANTTPTGAGERMAPQQGTGGGGTLSFTTPSGSTGSTGGGGGGGGIRLSDVTRMKESPSTPSIDLDVHQIMKDLKEYQELQQHHSAGSSRKADATTIPSQQQHDSVTDFLIGCDLDEDDFLFATNSYSYDGHKN